MSKHLRMDLERLQDELAAMAAAVEIAVNKAVAALRRRDAALAREVIDADDDIDDFQDQIETECLKLLALHQPVAGDLRRVTTAIRISVDLERMGDLAEGIAGRATRLAELPDFPMPDKLRPMADLTTHMVRLSLDAFYRVDAAQARAICRQDNDVDRHCAEIVAGLTAAMRAGGSEAVESGLSLFSAVSHLERIADHATNIAEDVVYLAEGEIVRHHPDLRRGQ
ncbi:MAG TPA: phosphate signaling complex protein PhoU [Gemmataceae bacterium]|nr:phosphate signaling complex protein PhoU [Gemmataceae bacterium]